MKNALKKVGNFCIWLSVVLVLGATLSLCMWVRADAKTWGPYTEPQRIRLIDGDTFEASVEVYDRIWVTRSFRLRGVDTPEKLSKQVCERELAKAATLFSADVLRKVKVIELRNVDEDKYAGRADATVMVDGQDLAVLLIAAGHARAYNGGKRLPWCADAVPGTPV
jgi:micrococcal nuclease